MYINPNAYFLLIVALVIAIVCACLLYLLHRKDMREFERFENSLKRKYIRVDTVLHNAIIEAYERAEEKGNNFEIKQYQRLLNEMRGKW